MKSNRLCQLLAIRYPIVQAPMNWITGAELAAAVSNAGGLGTLGPNAGAKTLTADVNETGERLRQQIRKTKSMTKEPFAVNFPIGLEGVEGEGSRAFCQKCVQVALEEGISVAITSVGAPGVYTKIFKDAGVKVLHAVSSAKQAKKAEEVGVDAVICEGYEGGGHKAPNGLGTLVMVPMTADIVKIPILAGGGIADVRGMVAALALGADGVYMGTRFMATLECDAHPLIKAAVINGAKTGTISINKWMMEGRDLKNNFTDKFTEIRTANAPPEEVLQFLNQHSMYQALVLGDAENSEIPCGENSGLINKVISADEVVSGIVNSIPSIMEKLKHSLT